MWLRGRGKLRREDQQYGEWLRVELIRQGRKTVVVISGKAHQQPLWWKKGQLCQGKDTSIPRRGGENHDAQSAWRLSITWTILRLSRMGRIGWFVNIVKGRVMLSPVGRT